ncbi:MAG: hypothetical protein ABII82_14985 [Verrucomicrobiota bacterium]
MASLPYRLASWLLQRLAISVLIGVLTLATVAVWQFVQDQRSEETRREQWIGRLTAERDAARQALEELQGRLSTDEAELLRQETRVAQSTRAIGQLEELDSFWRRWFVSADQRAANTTQLANMRTLRQEAQARVVELQTRVTSAHDGRLAAVLRLQTAELQLDKASRDTNRVVHYLRSAWLDIRWWLALGLGLLLIGPFLLRSWLYYGWARGGSHGEPLHLNRDASGPVTAGPSTPCLNESLWPGQTLRVRPDVLANTAHGLDQSSRGLLTWRHPLSSRWAGLRGLLDLHHGHTGSGRSVPLSSAGDGQKIPAQSLIAVDVPEGSGFTLRLRHLAGVVFNGEKLPPPVRRWHLLNRQARVSRQFGYFEFAGPCRLIVRAPALRAEVLVARDGLAVTERRLANASVLGFSTGLQVSPVRTERFGAYFTGGVELWKARFSGEGLVLVGEPTPGRLRRALGKLIGL